MMIFFMNPYFHSVLRCNLLLKKDFIVTSFQVVIFPKPGYEHQKHDEYLVQVIGSTQQASCDKANKFYAKFETGRSFYCEQNFLVKTVGIHSLNVQVPLTLCEVAVYSTGK